MPYKKIIPYINTEGKTYSDVLKLAKDYSDNGADELLIYNFSKDEKSREEFLKLAKQIARNIDIPFIIGSYVLNFEDIKRSLYTGASGIMFPYSLIEKTDLIKEVSNRFGKSKIYLEVDQISFMESDTFNDQCTVLGIGTLVINHVNPSDSFIDKLKNSPIPIIIKDDLKNNDIRNLITYPRVIGLTSDFYMDKDILKIKHTLFQDGIRVNIYESKLSFSEFKLNEDGLIPVITQDYKTGQVLMLAYMNEEAYNRTIIGGKMTYFSRSRQSLWLKGESSGNYQYVKDLSLDCDKDTLLAKVHTLGPACHTGSKTCFYTNLQTKEYKKSNPYQILEKVYDVIMDRKKNPKEGSYTTYLFEKGIDKILKKCGEEAAEIIIAAKNPETGELRYEIADFIYHLMVLMAECGLDWNDITTELEDRK